MADYYCETSFILPYPEGVEKNMIEDFIVNEFGDEDETYTVEIYLEPNGIWFHSENLDIGEAIWTVQKLLQEFYPDDFKVIFSWANYCGKPRLDSFSGGAAVVTKIEDKLFYPEQQAIEYAKSI